MSKNSEYHWLFLENALRSNVTKEKITHTRKHTLYMLNTAQKWNEHTRLYPNIQSYSNIFVYFVNVFSVTNSTIMRCISADTCSWDAWGMLDCQYGTDCVKCIHFVISIIKLIWFSVNFIIHACLKNNIYAVNIDPLSWKPRWFFLIFRNVHNLTPLILGEYNNLKVQCCTSECKTKGERFD